MAININQVNSYFVFYHSNSNQSNDEIINTSTGSYLQVFTGGGTDSYTSSGTGNTNELIHLGNDNDIYNLVNASSNNINMNAGNGSDIANIESGNENSIILDMGNGNDHINISNHPELTGNNINLKGGDGYDITTFDFSISDITHGEVRGDFIILTDNRNNTYKINRDIEEIRFSRDFSGRNNSYTPFGINNPFNPFNPYGGLGNTGSTFGGYLSFTFPELAEYFN